MTILKVPDMHCMNCVKRIEKALTDAGLTFTVTLEDHTVTVDGDAQSVQKAREALDNLGFDTI